MKKRSPGDLNIDALLGDKTQSKFVQARAELAVENAAKKAKHIQKADKAESERLKTNDLFGNVHPSDTRIVVGVLNSIPKEAPQRIAAEKFISKSIASFLYSPDGPMSRLPTEFVRRVKGKHAFA